MSSPTVIRHKTSSLYSDHFITVISYYENNSFLCAVQTYKQFERGYTALITSDVFSSEEKAIENFNSK